MKKIDKMIFSLSDKYMKYLIAVILLILAFVIRYAFIKDVSGDFIYFLDPWVKYIATHGGFKAIATIPANYNVPYLYILTLVAKWPKYTLGLIKLVSIFFDYLLAFGSCLLIRSIIKSKRKTEIGFIVFFIILFIPTVILNGAAWAQCDVIYSAFCIYSLYFLIKDKPVIAFILFGIAFAFKLQAIFILPVLIIIYFTNRKFSILNFFIIPIVSVILYLPALIVGRPLSQLISIYFNQAGQYKALSLNICNVYALFHVGDNGMIHKAGIIFTVVLFIALFYIVISSKKIIDGKLIVILALISVLIATYFLPGMHGRYTYLADVLSILYFVIRRNKYYIPIIIITNSFFTYINFLWGYNKIPFQYLAILQLIAIVIVIKDFYVLLMKAKDKANN